MLDLKKIAKPLLIATLIIVPGVAFAERYNDLRTISHGLSVQINSLKLLLLQISMISGIGFALAGMVKFKAHKDNPTQVTLGVPITLLLIGAGLVFLPNLIDAGGNSIFGADPKTIEDPYDFN